MSENENPKQLARWPRIFSGLLAVGIMSLFSGGLAYSIWENTESIVFPLIVGIVLVMVYVSFYEEVFSKSGRGSK